MAANFSIQTDAQSYVVDPQEKHKRYVYYAGDVSDLKNGQGQVDYWTDHGNSVTKIAIGKGITKIECSNWSENVAELWDQNQNKKDSMTKTSGSGIHGEGTRQWYVDAGWSIQIHQPI